MRLQLYVESAEDSVYLDLPAAPVDIDKIIKGTVNGPRQVDIIGVSTPIHGLSQYIAHADVTNPKHMEQLNTLTDRIDRMEDRERDLFAGALDSESINGLEDVLRISEHLDDYVILPNINNDTELGRFLVDTGYKFFPEAVHPYLDYRAIGSEYYAENGGAYGPGGYVRRKNSVEQAAVVRPEIITLYLHPPGADETTKPYRLSLPSTDAQLDLAKTRLNINHFSDALITKIEFGQPYLEDLIPQDGFCVEDADELAYSVREMQRKDGEFMKYLAVLSVMRPETLKGALDLAIDLDCFEMVPDDAEEYGKQILRRHGADDEIIDAINGYMDFQLLGEDSMREDGVRRTEYGLIRSDIYSFPKETQSQVLEENTIKLYMPLKAELFYYNEEDEDYDMSGDGVPQDGWDLLAYKSEIKTALADYRMPEEVQRGLMHWYADRDDADKSVDEKVKSAVFTVEERNGQLWGVAECQVAGRLTSEELSTLKDYIRGQASDGWGEGFEQQEIKVGENEAMMFAHLWSPGDSWNIMTEKECFGSQGVEQACQQEQNVQMM